MRIASTPLSKDKLMASVARLITLVVLFAFAAVTEALAQAACWQCHTNFPVGLQCRQEAVGAGVCWEDAQGCHTSGSCVPELPMPDGAQASLSRYPDARASLVEIGDGLVFLLADDGLATEVAISPAGILQVATCAGGRMGIEEYVEQMRLVIIARSLNREAQAQAIIAGLMQ